MNLSISHLRRVCQEQKSIGKEGVLLEKGYFFHRKISIYITKFLLSFFPNILPNTVSFFMILISFLGCVFFTFSYNSDNATYLMFIGLLLIYFGFLLDKVDGEIARFKKKITIQGIYLDEIYHAIIPSFVFITFFFGVVITSPVNSLFLMILILLTLFNRYNRKIISVITLKVALQNLLHENKKKIVRHSFLHRFFSKRLFSISSLVHRFDIVLGFILLLVLIENLGMNEFRIFGFYTLFVLHILFFVRWTCIYYGEVEDQVFLKLSEIKKL